MNNKFAVLVFGYEKYKIIWSTYFKLFKKNWENDYKIYLSSCENSANYENVTYIKNSEKLTWTERLHESLNFMSEDYVFFMLEDFFITKPVNQARIKRITFDIAQNDIQYFKFKIPFFSIKYKNKYKRSKTTYFINKERKYGISIQPSIWNRKYLMYLLEGIKLNAWEFEKYLSDNKQKDFIFGSENKHIFCKDNVFNIHNAMIKGRLTPTAVKLIKNEGYYTEATHKMQINILIYYIFIIKHLLRYILHT